MTTQSTNAGNLKIENITNVSLSQSAVDAIGKELLDEESVNHVSVICTDECENSCFDVYDKDGQSYLFSVDNEGNIYTV